VRKQEGKSVKLKIYYYSFVRINVELFDGDSLLSVREAAIRLQHLLIFEFKFSFGQNYELDNLAFS